MNNKVFYQHPNLMRILGMHETVMEVMVNVLGGHKSQVEQLLPLYFSLPPQAIKEAPTEFTAPRAMLLTEKVSLLVQFCVLSFVTVH